MKILGTGSALPKLSVTNDMLTQYFDTSDAWISTRTGIKQRQIMSTEHLDDLAAEASRKALENAGLQAEDLDFIICSNVLDEYVSPALGCRVQGLIGAHCPCINMNGACAGFIFALSVAEAYLNNGMARRILVLAAEMPTRMVDWKERGTAVLFGDGAGAVVIGEGSQLKSIRLSTKSAIDCLYQKQFKNKTPFDAYENQADEKQEDNYSLHMNGKEVFKLAVSASMRDIQDMLDEHGMTHSDVDHYLLHQANTRIVDAICQHLKEDESKFHHNIHRTGNTSSASIPILLDEIKREGKLKAGDHIIMSAFGAGFSTGTCLLEW